MYQMQSILTACYAPDTKLPKDWFRNQSTQELLSEISLDRIFSVLHKTHENREEQRVGKKTWSPKLYENREKLRPVENRGSPKLYENREEQRVGKKTWSPKLYENREEQRPRLFSGSPKTHENREEQRVGKKSYSPKTHENRENLPNGLRGWYVHRLLVNAVAMWASPLHLKYIFIEFSNKNHEFP
ncbi:hypothetical protein TVAG_188460 [Trichomonas vaginalis G3]|uniref:KilA/APSES-type HTH DNA-binding domain-containing protein n=1 Tax=Trichomonas vaginalis (strain ATCC PRA-98 / G3) TaxID=412133 RepID=A2GCJ4_TRIV3|nr:KilA, N-terminal/APSES-type HTH, DNA-binding family [Trichomonas vaginalis G3]EAX85124.1 hypothetical protein TVAG_188460 [Trichomonas vaginalis G3]KAI5496150.1 KilA, N-terminal/APSES-type HTH, DNA-binding family [Trichomonas vaginalis G3]|eukprot:XP_001298054.1 hypothetical protein [Trichomonas vaginalis G3]